MTKPHLYLLMLANSSLSFELDSWPKGKQSTEAMVLSEKKFSENSGQLPKVRSEKVEAK